MRRPLRLAVICGMTARDNRNADVTFSESIVCHFATSVSTADPGTNAPTRLIRPSIRPACLTVSTTTRVTSLSFVTSALNPSRRSMMSWDSTRSTIMSFAPAPERIGVTTEPSPPLDPVRRIIFPSSRIIRYCALSLDFQVLIGFPYEHLGSRAGIGRQSPRTGCHETDGIAVMEHISTFEFGTPLGNEEMHVWSIGNLHRLPWLEPSTPQHRTSLFDGNRRLMASP